MNNILLYPILVSGGTNIGPYWFPLPIPILGFSESLLPGGNQIKRKTMLILFYHFNEKSENHQ